MTKVSPIALFTYNRLSETQKTLKALQNNYLAKESELYIFSDGAKKTSDQLKIDNVRKYIRNQTGFKKIIIQESDKNKGLANSIIQGVSEVLSIHGKVIVLEDDLVTSPNFLDYMNQALNYYQNNNKIISISGYTLDLPSLSNYQKDYYLGKRASSWGWGTWEDRWNKMDWEVLDYDDFYSSFRKRYLFSRIGSDMPRMLKNQMEGIIDSWAIRWCYHQFKNDFLTVFASISKIKSIGSGSDATHTSGVTRFETPLDEGARREFSFDENLEVNKQILKEFRSKFSIKARAIDRLKKTIK